MSASPEIPAGQTDLSFYGTPLYQLLDTTFSDKEYRTVQGILNIRALARKLEMSHEGLYKWLRSGRVSPQGARNLISLSKNKLGSTELYPFLIA